MKTTLSEGMLKKEVKTESCQMLDSVKDVQTLAEVTMQSTDTVCVSNVSHII